MAKFGSYFLLCSLVDQKSLLGISEDHEADNVILTLGKNTAMKYGLMNQNQITSWTTKDTFTSPVIFNSKTGKYIAVFNNLFVRIWGTEISNLNEVRKLKFKVDIETILSINNTSFVIFKTGDILFLEYAIANHKTLNPEMVIDVKEEFILENMYCTLGADTYIGLLIASRDSRKASYILWTSFDSKGNKSEYSKLSLKCFSELVGCCFQIFDNQIQILTLWSDGRLRVKSIEDPSEHCGDVFCVIESVSCENPVSLLSLDRDYLAIYGDNSNQEGALLIIYNMQFKVTQCMQPFKLQAMGVKLHKINEKLFVPVGQNLTVVPYHLEKEQLSALVGSHSCDNSRELQLIPQIEVNWGESNIDKKKKLKTNTIIEEYLIQGCPESIIFQNLLPEFIEKTNITDLKILLQDFIDIPEKFLSKSLFYILELPEKAFKNGKLYENDCYPECLQPFERYEILKIIFDKPLPEINNKVFWKIDIIYILKLLKFILFLLTYDKTLTVDSWEKLAQWLQLIMCANFQLFLLSPDDELINVLLAINNIIDKQHSTTSEELLYSIKINVNGKKIPKMAEKNYAIEKMYL